ncbi:SMC-Scp complex subunit ScpB [Patescibacteria group bacterium]
MASLKQKVESLLFVAGRPVPFKDLAKFTKAMVPEVKDKIDELKDEYGQNEKGMQIILDGNEAQMVSHGDTRIVTEPFLKEDIEGKLSRAALETLSIIAYRQPVTRPEIDFIRGVNSTIMLRNLLMRGLVDRQRSKKDARMFEYKLSLDFLKLLGISRREELPDFADLNQSDAMRVLEKAMSGEEKSDEASPDAKDVEEKRGEADYKKNKEYSVPVNIHKKDSDQ